MILALPIDSYTILGALSGIMVIFPRLIMHKAINTVGNEKSLVGVKDKTEYGVLKIIALNLTSAAGFVQVFMLAAIIMHSLDLFTLGYFVVNLIICIVSLHSILTTEEERQQAFNK